MHLSVFLVSSPSCSTRQLMGMPFPSPGDLPNPGIEPRSSALQADSLPADPQGKPKNTGVGSISLLQGIFPTQGSNPGLPHCRQILYQLSWGISNFYWGYTNFICLFTKALFSGVLEIWVSNFFDTLNSPTFGGFWHHFMILSSLEKFRMEKKFPKAVKLGALTYPRWLVKKCQLRE